MSAPAHTRNYPTWRYPEFQRLIQYQATADPQLLRQEVFKLRQQGWTEKRIAQLLRCSRNTVMKWLRRARQAESQPDDRRLWLLDLSRAPHRTSRKVFFGANHAVLELQKKYGYAGASRIKGYLEKDYGIAKTRFTCIFNNFARHSPNHYFPDQNSHHCSNGTST